MKKILKKIIVYFSKFFYIILKNFKIGRYFLYNLNVEISNEKKNIIIKNKKFTFYVPNDMNNFRFETFLTKEPETLNWINTFEKNKTFWDVGANIGLYSCYAAKIKDTKVYAFEPSIFNLELLGKNIYENKETSKITIVPIPLNDKILESTLNYQNTELGGALSTFGEKVTHDGSKFKDIFKFSIVGLTMDDVGKSFGIPQPDYLKIDVDGIEYLILKGGEVMLKNVNSIMVEVNENLENKNKISELLIRSGFELKEKYKSEIFKNSNIGNIQNQLWVKNE